MPGGLPLTVTVVPAASSIGITVSFTISFSLPFPPTGLTKIKTFLKGLIAGECDQHSIVRAETKEGHTAISCLH